MSSERIRDDPRRKKEYAAKKPRGYPWAISHYQKENQCTCHEPNRYTARLILVYPKEQYITSTTLVDVRWSPLEESNLTTSIPRFYVIGLEDRCGDRGLYLDKILLLIRNIFTLVIQMG